MPAYSQAEVPGIDALDTHMHTCVHTHVRLSTHTQGTHVRLLTHTQGTHVRLFTHAGK